MGRPTMSEMTLNEYQTAALRTASKPVSTATKVNSVKVTKAPVRNLRTRRCCRIRCPARTGSSAGRR